MKQSAQTADLLSWSPPSPPRFDGAVYSPPHDDKRLTGQIKRVHGAMIGGAWKTLGEIEAITGDPQASISAQMRHLRKERFGAFVLEKRPRGERERGLWEYRLSAPTSQTIGEI